MSDKLLNDADVLRAIRGELLRGGCPREEVDDKVRDVVEEVWRYLEAERAAGRGDVETVDRMKAIVRPRAYQRGIDALRQKQAGGKIIQGSLEGAPEPASRTSSLEDQVDARRALENIRQHQEKHDAGILEGIAQGESHAETAARMNLSYGHVRNEVVSLRERHGRRLHRLGFAIAGVVLAVTVVVFIVRMPGRDDGQVAAIPPRDRPTSDAAREPTRTLEQQKEVARLRALGHGKAIEKDYRACWDAYFAAERLDPAGTSPEANAEATWCKRELDKLDATPSR
jgi:hypothetical protein